MFVVHRVPDDLICSENLSYSSCSSTSSSDPQYISINENHPYPTTTTTANNHHPPATTTNNCPASTTKNDHQHNVNKDVDKCSSKGNKNDKNYEDVNVGRGGDEVNWGKLLDMQTPRGDGSGSGREEKLEHHIVGKHHRKISSIAPVITQTSKYKDEYDLSQEEMIENFISWKKHFEIVDHPDIPGTISKKPYY